MKNGQVLRLEDEKVRFKTAELLATRCFFTDAILGLQNHSKEIKKAKKSKNLSNDLSGVFDVYTEVITKTPLYDIGYIIQDENTDNLMYLPSSVVFYMLDNPEAEENADFHIVYTFNDAAYVTFNGKKYSFVGTLVGDNLPDGYTHDNGAVYVGMPLSFYDIKELVERTSYCDKSAVISYVLDTYKEMIEELKHYSVILEFFKNELNGEDTKEQVFSMIHSMMNDEDGRAMLVDLMSDVFSCMNK